MALQGDGGGHGEPRGLWHGGGAGFWGAGAAPGRAPAPRAARRPAAPAGDDLRTAAQRGESTSLCSPSVRSPSGEDSEGGHDSGKACLLGMTVGSVRMQRRMRRPA